MEFPLLLLQICEHPPLVPLHKSMSVRSWHMTSQCYCICTLTVALFSIRAQVGTRVTTAYVASSSVSTCLGAVTAIDCTFVNV